MEAPTPLPPRALKAFMARPRILSGGFLGPHASSQPLLALCPSCYGYLYKLTLCTYNEEKNAC